MPPTPPTLRPDAACPTIRDDYDRVTATFKTYVACSLRPVPSGPVPTTQAAKALAKSGMTKKELGRLWTLADVDRDGELSRQEFAIAMHLAACTAGKGLPLPRVLPECLVAIVTTVGGAKYSDKGGSTEGVNKPEKGTSKGKPSAANKGTKGVAHKTARNAKVQAKTSVPSKTSVAAAAEGSGPGQGLPTTQAIVSAPTSRAEKATAANVKPANGESLLLVDSGGQGRRQEAETETQPVRAANDETAISVLPGNCKSVVAAKKTILTAEERDPLYAMSTTERAGYDVVFMQVCWTYRDLQTAVP